MTYAAYFRNGSVRYISSIHDLTEADWDALKCCVIVAFEAPPS